MRKIVLYPDPVLTTPPAPVTDFGDELKAIVKEMFRALYACRSGVGLAAVQIGVPLNLFVIDTGASDRAKYEVGRKGETAVACNAEYISREDLHTVKEGCLSFPSLQMPVVRAKRIHVRAQDLDGNWFEMKPGPKSGDENDADRERWEFEAQVIQHEMDHCAGRICFDLAPREYRRALPSMIKEAKRKGRWKVDLREGQRA